MVKKIYLMSFIIVLLVSFLIMALLSGCSSEVGTAVDASITESVEVLEESEEPEEIESAEDIQGEDADIDVQIISISPEEVLDIINNDEDYQIVDVRTEEEYNGGHLEDALLIPVQELEGRLDELSGDRSIIVYCRSGARSRNAAEILVNNGFTMIYDMGGINAWIDKGYPVVKEK